ncbi:hypothetical protein ABPG75_001015 [Micractinium tetrahymenae]
MCARIFLALATVGSSQAATGACFGLDVQAGLLNVTKSIESTDLRVETIKASLDQLAANLTYQDAYQLWQADMRMEQDGQPYELILQTTFSDEQWRQAIYDAIVADLTPGSQPASAVVTAYRPFPTLDCNITGMMALIVKNTRKAAAAVKAYKQELSAT